MPSINLMSYWKIEFLQNILLRIIKMLSTVKISSPETKKVFKIYFRKIPQRFICENYFFW